MSGHQSPISKLPHLASTARKSVLNKELTKEASLALSTERNKPLFLQQKKISRQKERETSRNRLYEASKKPSTQMYTQSSDPDPDIAKLQKDFDRFSKQFENTDEQQKKYNRVFKIHSFIFDKKHQNAMKYTHESKLNNVAVPVPKGTVSIMLNTEKKNSGYMFGQKMSETAKFKFKWKTVQWLLTNKKEICSTIWDEKTRLWQMYCKIDEDKRMRRGDFQTFMSSPEISLDQAVIDKLYYIFDDENKGSIEFKDLLVGIEMFRCTKSRQLIRSLIEIADIEHAGYVTMEDLFHVFKCICFKAEEKARVKSYIKEVCARVQKDARGFFSTFHFEQSCANHIPLINFIQESMAAIKRVDKMIENDLEEHFQVWVPMSSNMYPLFYLVSSTRRVSTSPLFLNC